jgi:hypothetical protein
VSVGGVRRRYHLLQCHCVRWSLVQYDSEHVGMAEERARALQRSKPKEVRKGPKLATSLGTAHRARGLGGEDRSDGLLRVGVRTYSHERLKDAAKAYGPKLFACTPVSATLSESLTVRKESMESGSRGCGNCFGAVLFEAQEWWYHFYALRQSLCANGIFP